MKIKASKHIRVPTSKDMELPKWAIKEIRTLSDRTGINFSKMRDAVLGLGIYNAKEQFGPTVNLVESAIAMAKMVEEESPQNESVHEISTNIESPINREQQDEPESTVAPEPGPTPAENSGLPLDGYVQSDPSEARLKLVSERRTESSEIGPDSEFVDSLSGE